LLRSYFARMRARTKILIFDTGISSFVCQQGDSFFSKNGGNSLFIGTKNASFDIPSKKRGVVTGLLLDAIRGKADSNYDGLITAWEILAFLGNAKNDKSLTPKERGVEFCTSMQGTNFGVTLTDKKVEEIRIEAEKRKRESKKSKSNDKGSSRTDKVELDKQKEKPKKRNGDDYALLFAFDDYDKGWTKLRNPQNDIQDVALELKNRYKFKEVITKVNLTKEEFQTVIEGYKEKTFKEDDQLFIFLAGHGIAAKNPPNNGYLVVKNSESPTIFRKRKTDSFIKLDELLGDIGSIKSKHIMTVFDACFAGQIWRPSVTFVKSELALIESPRRQIQRKSVLSKAILGLPSRVRFVNAFYQQDDDKLTKDELIYRELKNYSYIVLTSGHNIVSDGKPGTNSPFAKQFLEALRKGADENGLLTLPDIMRYVKRARNKTPSELGRIDKQGEKMVGGFVFCQGGCVTKQSKGTR